MEEFVHTGDEREILGHDGYVRLRQLTLFSCSFYIPRGEAWATPRSSVERCRLLNTIEIKSPSHKPRRLAHHLSTWTRNGELDFFYGPEGPYGSSLYYLWECRSTHDKRRGSRKLYGPLPTYCLRVMRKGRSSYSRPILGWRRWEMDRRLE
jgi:hypothetical protein